MPLQSVSATLGGLPLVNWSPDYSEETHYKANSYHCPLGKQPGVGYALMLASNVKTLYAQTGNFSQPTELILSAGGVVTFPELWIEQAVAISGGAPGNNDRCYLLTLRDVRSLLTKFTDCNLQINVRRPTPLGLGGEVFEYYQTTLFDGQPYTWQEAVNAIVGQIGTLAEVLPELPYTPDGVPENLQFVGVSAWDALHVVLDKLDCTTAYDPTTGAFDIISQGLPQEGLAAAEAANATRLDDADPYSNFTLSLPAAFRVYFHKQEIEGGTEIDTTDEFNAAGDAFGLVYKIELPTGVANAAPGSVKAVWDDLRCQVTRNTGGAELYLNSDDLQARAEARLSNWINRQKSSADRMRRVYQGVAEGFMPGSQVQAVEWFDFGQGWQTAVVRRPQSESNQGDGVAAAAESIAPPDYPRASFPVWPRNLQLIQLQNAEKDESGYWQASVLRRSPIDGSRLKVESCLAIEATPGATRRREPCGVYFGRLNGSATDAEGYTLPLYLLESGPGQVLMGKADADIATEETGAVTVWDGKPGAEEATTTTVQLYNSSAFKIKAEEFVYFTDDCTGPRLIPVGSKPILGKPVAGIGNKKSGEVTIYSVPEGGEQGGEEEGSPPQQVAAFNRFFGYIPKETWVFCQNDGDGWYISACIQSDHLLGRVPPNESAGTVEAHMAPTQIEIQIQTSDQAVSYDGNEPTVNAFVRFQPVFDGEQVAVVWTGSVFTIVASEFSGGILAKTESTISKGGTSSAYVTLAIEGQTPGPALEGSVQSPLGSIETGKLFWISRNKNGLFGTSAEC